jgi:hypothetical protein
MASSASSLGPSIPDRIRLQPRLSSVAPPFCEQSACLPAAHSRSRLVSGRSSIRAAGNADIGMGCQGITPHDRAPKRAKVDLGVRHRRSSDRVVNGQSTPRSKYRNHAAVPPCGGQKAWPTPTRSDGAGQSGLAYREAAQVAKTNHAIVLAAIFAGTESCRAAVAVVSRPPLEQPRLPRRSAADPRGKAKSSPASPGRSPFNLRNSLGHAQGSRVNRIRPSTVSQACTAVPSTRHTSAGLVRPSRISDRACMHNGDMPLSIAIR